MEHIHEFTFLSISDRKTGLPLLPEISFAGKAQTDVFHTFQLDYSVFPGKQPLLPVH